ncbi:MAG TPA: NUDIX domain-containing protein [Longimicrobiales bacterium]
MRHKTDRAAGVIVFRRVGAGCRFLLVLSRRTKRPLWEFPKGGVDAGEEVLEAALRELHEETGLSGDAVRLIPGFERSERYRFSVGKGANRTLIRKSVTYFLAEALREDVRISPEEAHEYAWLDVDEAYRRIRYKERRRILAAAAKAAGCPGPARSSGRPRPKRT